MSTKTQVNRAGHAITRRAFLRRTTAAGAGAVLAMPLIVPGRVFGADGTVAPSNRINMGFIGTGRQVFFANLPWHLVSEETQVVAGRDVDSWRLEKAKARIARSRSPQSIGLTNEPKEHKTES